jgi:hypothetical protein
VERVSPKSRRRRSRSHTSTAAPLLAASVYVMPDLVNGFAYLTGHDNAATFLPQAHEQVCTGRYGCSTETTGILVTGHTRTATTWPTQVPLGKPFPVREPVLNWGIGGTLLRSYPFAVLSFIFGLFMTVHDPARPSRAVFPRVLGAAAVAALERAGQSRRIGIIGRP